LSKWADSLCPGSWSGRLAPQYPQNLWLLSNVFPHFPHSPSNLLIRWCCTVNIFVLTFISRQSDTLWHTGRCLNAAFFSNLRPQKLHYTCWMFAAFEKQLSSSRIFIGSCLLGIRGSIDLRFIEALGVTWALCDFGWILVQCCLW
jgi:hypothetical protein